MQVVVQELGVGLWTTWHYFRSRRRCGVAELQEHAGSLISFA